MTALSYVVDVEDLPDCSSTEVQDNWGKVVREVRFKGRIAITSRGHADMVIMSREEYDRSDGGVVCSICGYSRSCG